MYQKIPFHGSAIMVNDDFFPLECPSIVQVNVNGTSLLGQDFVYFALFKDLKTAIRGIKSRQTNQDRKTVGDNKAGITEALLSVTKELEIKGYSSQEIDWELTHQ